MFVAMMCFSLMFSQCRNSAAEEFKVKGGLRLHLVVDQSQLSDAHENTVAILSRRIKSYGAPFTLEWVEDKKYFLLEMADVKEPERVMKMLNSNGVLEFWETFNIKEIYSNLIEADAALKSVLPSEQNAEEFEQQHPLFSKLAISSQGGELIPGPIVGYVSKDEVNTVSKYLEMPEVKSVLPFNIEFKWAAKPINEDARHYELYALKKVGRTKEDEKFGGDIVEEAASGRNEYDYYVTLQMTPEAGRQWQRMTKENIGRNIAIVVDGVVYSAPVVMSEIIGGRSMISGNLTHEEVKDLANILNSGIISAKVTVVHNEIVPPQNK